MSTRQIYSSIKVLSSPRLLRVSVRDTLMSIIGTFYSGFVPLYLVLEKLGKDVKAESRYVEEGWNEGSGFPHLKFPCWQWEIIN
jgi:hypothetical protein